MAMEIDGFALCGVGALWNLHVDWASTCGYAVNLFLAPQRAGEKDTDFRVNLRLNAMLVWMCV